MSAPTEPVHSPWGLGSGSILFDSATSGVRASAFSTEICDWAKPGSLPPIGTLRNHNAVAVPSVEEEIQSVSALKAKEDEVIFQPRAKNVTEQSLSPVVDTNSRRDTLDVECGHVASIFELLSERLSHIGNEKGVYNEGSPHCLLARALSSSPRNSYFSSYPHEATSLSAPSSTVSSRSSSQVKLAISAPTSRCISTVKLPLVPLPLELSECVFSQEGNEENKDEVKRALDYLHTLSDECIAGIPTANMKPFVNVFGTSGMESIFSSAGSRTLNDTSTSDQFNWSSESIVQAAAEYSLRSSYDQIFESKASGNFSNSIKTKEMKSELVVPQQVSDILGSIENSVNWSKPQCLPAQAPVHGSSCSASSEEVDITPEVPTNLPVIFVPVEVPQIQTNSSRPACKYWKRGNCRYGENCNFSHSRPLKLTEKATVENSLASSTVPNTHYNSAVPKSPPSLYNKMLSKEESLATLRFMAHVEEIEANFPDTILRVNRGKNELSPDEELIITISEFCRLLESRYDAKPVPVLETLNQILNPSEPLSLIECISAIVPELPAGTLDLDTILNTKRTAHNDALLFFCSILSDIEQHFSGSEFSAKYLRRNIRNTCENTTAIEKVLLQVGITEDILMKLELSEMDKGKNEFFRWKSLFISNDPSLISFPSMSSTNFNDKNEMDMKWRLLRSLDGYVRSSLQSDSGAASAPYITSPSASLPPFEIIHLRYFPARGHNHRRNLWTDFVSTRDPVSVHIELCAHVAKLNVNSEKIDSGSLGSDSPTTRELIANFPFVLSKIQEKCKLLSENPRNTKRPTGNCHTYTLDTKLSKISKVLDTCPRLLLLPDLLLKENGKVHRYKSVTVQHQFGSIFTEMMTMLKRKYLHN